MNTGAGFSCYFFVDSVIAFITAARRPPRSSAATPTIVPPGELPRLSWRRDAGRFLQNSYPGTRCHLPCQAVGRIPGQAVQHRGIIQRFVKSPKKKPARYGYGPVLYYFFWIASMASITAARRPPRSGAATPTMVAPPGEPPRLSWRRDAGRFLQRSGPGTRYHLPGQAIGRIPGQAVQHRGIIQRFVKSPKKKPARYGYGPVLYYFFWIASMASITAARRPPRSSAATPTMVVPPGEHTASFIAAGCWPLSTNSCPVPATICPARR